MKNICPARKRMHLICSAWVEFPNTRDDSRGGKHTNSVKNMCLWHFVDVSFITSKK